MTGGHFDTSVLANEMYNQAFRLRRDGRGLGARGVPVRPGHPDRHLPDPQPAPAAARRADDDHRQHARVARRRRRPSRPDRGRPGAQAADQPHRERRLDRHRAAVDHPDLRPVHLLVPARGRDQDQRLVELLHRPAVHPGELPGRAVRHARRSSGQLAELLHQLAGHHHPVGAVPAGLLRRWPPTRWPGPSSAGRDWIYIGIFALQIVPLQMALVPLLQLLLQGVTSAASAAAGLGPGRRGTFVQVWFAHTCFALPLGVFLLHNFMSELPGDLIEAARVDGASHATIFRQVVLPLIVPALASLRASSSSSGSGTTCWSR